MNGRSVKGVVSIATRPWVATCEETQERLSAHLEGGLQGRQAKRVLRHLVRCPHCREALRTLARAVTGLRALGQADSLTAARPSFADGVVGRIRGD